MRRILFFTIIITFYYSFLNAQTIDRVEGIIGDRIVLTSDIEMKYLQFLSQGITNSSELRCSIFEDLLYEKLLAHRAEIDSLEIGDQEINEEVEKRVDYYVNQIGSVEKMESYFKKKIYSIKMELKDMVREQFLAQRMQATITSNIKVTPSEIRLFFNEFALDEIPEIESRVTIHQLVVSPEISKKEINRVREKLNNFRDRIIKGEDFKVLAALYSDDPSATNNGGEIGFVNRGDLVSEFERVAFRLKENEISEVVESKYGFHIIQLIERRGEQINVRHILIKPKVSSSDLLTAKEEISRIAKMIKDSTITFLEAVKEYSDDDSKNNDGLLVNPSTGSISFPISDLGPSLRYVVDGMMQGDISSPTIIEQEDGSKAYRIILLKDKTDSHLANLVDDYELIQSQALADKKQKRINHWIDKQIDQTYIYLSNQYINCDLEFKWKK